MSISSLQELNLGSRDDWACLDWPLLLNALRRHCQLEAASVKITTPNLWLASEHEVLSHVTLVSELRQLIERYGDEAIQGIPDIVSTLKRIQVEGRFYAVSEVAELAFSLAQLSQLLRFVVQYKTPQETPQLVQFVHAIHGPQDVILALEQIIEPQLGASLRDSASSKYRELEEQIRFIRADIEARLTALIPRIGNLLQETLFTQRDGRYVLPVQAAFQSQVDGLLLDASASGETVYIEPKAIAKDSIRLRQAIRAREEEIQIILNNLSDTIRPDIPVVLEFIDRVIDLDILMAKARLSLELDATAVQPEPTLGVIALNRAKHPLLCLAAKKNGLTVVANNLIYSETCRCVIVSGPNTGGKTITLKMLGLFALMLHCGLHLPVAEGSRLSLFAPIMADSGDSQSVVQNLSTFSAHLIRLKDILDAPDLSRSLILIDEIGAGTDPAEATALAESVLKHLVHEHAATVMVTTHLSSLKRLAYQETGFENASVEFDTQTLQPTYRLLLGSAGQSHAVEIAQILGLPQVIIDEANQLLSERQTSSDELISELETRQAKAQILLREAEELKAKLDKDSGLLSDKLNRLDGEKRQILETYRSQMSEQFRTVQKTLDTAKDILKRKKQGPSDLRYVAKKLNQAKDSSQTFSSEAMENLYQDIQIAWDVIQVGDLVTSKSFNLKGEVLSKQDKAQTLTIQSGLIKTTIPLSDVIRVDAKSGHVKASLDEGRQQRRIIRTMRTMQETEKGPRIPFRECKVLGMTSEDAVGVMEKFLDEALMDNISTVAVIHGRGTGALKHAIRSVLAELPFVESYYPAEAIDGGDGKTIIELR